MQKIKVNNAFRGFKEFKTYTPEEIVNSGGTDVFAKKIGLDYKKLFETKGERFTEEEYQKGLSMLTK